MAEVENGNAISAGESFSMRIQRSLVQGSRDMNAYPILILDEIALYDRQIRLWGVQAQEKSVSESPILPDGAFSNQVCSPEFDPRIFF